MEVKSVLYLSGIKMDRKYSGSSIETSTEEYIPPSETSSECITDSQKVRMFWASDEVSLLKQALKGFPKYPRINITINIFQEQNLKEIIVQTINILFWPSVNI